MFASLPQQPPPPPPPPSATAQNMFYLPSQPSPLSPRSSNIQSSRPIFSMSPSPSSSPSQSKPALFSEANKAPPRRSNTQSPTTSYAQRYAERISNPAANISRRRSPAGTTTSSSTSATSRQPASSTSSTSPRDKRRDVFLNRVKRDREEGRFESRAEQILRMDYLAQRRKYEEAMARSAPNLEPGVEDEDEGMGDVDEADELDEYLAEAGETDYDALLKRLEREEERGQDRDRDSWMDGGDERSFDEEDYDSIFMDMLSSQDPADAPQFSQSMDTSGG